MADTPGAPKLLRSPLCVPLEQAASAIGPYPSGYGGFRWATASHPPPTWPYCGQLVSDNGLGIWDVLVK